MCYELLLHEEDETKVGVWRRGGRWRKRRQKRERKRKNYLCRKVEVLQTQGTDRPALGAGTFRDSFLWSHVIPFPLSQTALLRVQSVICVCLYLPHRLTLYLAQSRSPTNVTEKLIIKHRGC